MAFTEESIKENSSFISLKNFFKQLFLGLRIKKSSSSLLESELFGEEVHSASFSNMSPDRVSLISLFVIRAFGSSVFGSLVVDSNCRRLHDGEQQLEFSILELLFDSFNVVLKKLESLIWLSSFIIDDSSVSFVYLIFFLIYINNYFKSVVIFIETE